MKPYQDGARPAMRRIAVSTPKLLGLAVLGLGILASVPVVGAVAATAPMIDDAAPLQTVDKKKKKQQSTRRGSWGDDGQTTTSNPGR